MYILNILQPFSFLSDCLHGCVIACILLFSPNITSLHWEFSFLSSYPSFYLPHSFLVTYMSLSPFYLFSLPFCLPFLLSLHAGLLSCTSYTFLWLYPYSPCLPLSFFAPFLTSLLSMHNCWQTLNDLGSCMASSDIIFLFNWILHCGGKRNKFVLTINPNCQFEDFEASLENHMAKYCGLKKSPQPTILDKINGTSGPPLPPFQWCQNGAFLAPSCLHHCFGGGWGIIVPFYTVQDCLTTTLALQKAMFAMQNTSDLLLHVR